MFLIGFPSMCRTHRVPLSDRALAIIKALPRESTAATDCHKIVMVVTLNIRARFERLIPTARLFGRAGAVFRYESRRLAGSLASYLSDAEPEPQHPRAFIAHRDR
jgi:hypothetical protein